MKRFKKLMALVMAMCVVGAMSATALAAEKTANCPDCGTEMSAFQQWTDWGRTGGERSCTHYTWNTDLEEWQIEITTYLCPNCGAGYEQSGRIQSRWVCYGFNQAPDKLVPSTPKQELDNRITDVRGQAVKTLGRELAPNEGMYLEYKGDLVLAGGTGAELTPEELATQYPALEVPRQLGDYKLTSVRTESFAVPYFGEGAELPPKVSLDKPYTVSPLPPERVHRLELRYTPSGQDSPALLVICNRNTDPAAELRMENTVALDTDGLPGYSIQSQKKDLKKFYRFITVQDGFTVSGSFVGGHTREEMATLIKSLTSTQKG